MFTSGLHAVSLCILILKRELYGPKFKTYIWKGMGISFKKVAGYDSKVLGSISLNLAKIV